MNFLYPAAFILLLLLPLIVLLYLLRLRRPERIVSSTYLWQRMVLDLQADAPWQRLRPNLLMFLQLLFLLALILALARPSSLGEGLNASSAILILDTSASMAATDLTPNRMEAAKDQAHRLVDRLPQGALITIIEAGPQARVLLSSSDDRRNAHQTIESLQFTSGDSDMAVALQIASAIASRQPETQVAVLSDGKVNLPKRIDLPAKLTYLPIGQRGENQAISQLTIEQSPDAETATAFAQVTNYGDAHSKRRLSLYADGGLVYAQDIDLPPGETRSAVVKNLSYGTKIVEARLSSNSRDENSYIDHLPLDDRAFAVLHTENPDTITMISESNRFLETGLKLLPGVELTQTKPDDLGQLPESDLLVIDGSIPLTTTLPGSNLLFIGPLRSTQYFTITGHLEHPSLQPAVVNSPLLTNLYLDTVQVLDAAEIDLPEWADPIIVADLADGNTSESSAILFVGETDNRRIAVLAFDIRRSDLPLQVAFPMLLVNLVDWLIPERSTGLPTLVAPGQAIQISTPSIETDSVSVLRPDGSQVQLSIEDGRAVFADTQHLGLYQVQWSANRESSESLAFAVNLFTPQESQIAPDQTPDFATAGVANTAQSTERIPQEWWRIFAVIALLLLTIEWLIYQRSAVAWIFQRIRQDGNHAQRPS